LAISFDRVAEKYDSTRALPDEVMKEIFAAFERMMSRDTVILDAGVGTGRFSLPMQEHEFEVVGVDISMKMLRRAREKGVQNLFRGNMCSLPFMDNAFQFSFSVHVLHLIKDWKCALGEIGRVTTDEYLSVLSEKSGSPAQGIRNTYDAACKDLGFDVHHVGLRERELPDLLPPDSYTKLLLYEHTIDVPSLIEEYQDRLFSDQWIVPEDIHEQAMEVVRERFEGVESLLEIEDIRIATWDAGRIRNFCLR
jgi:SAM-dependent methyltransferase